MLDKFLSDNSTSMRLARTVVSGVVSATMVFVPAAIGWLDITPETASFATAVLMSIFSPVMSLLKKSDTIEEE